MIFLLEYNRREGKLISLQNFDRPELARAQADKLQLELKLNAAGIDHEVVLLEAANEEALRNGYRRYFQDLDTLLRTTADALKVHVTQF